jgi:hypothetical protein
MIRKTILEMISLLLLALCIAMLHHSLSSTGITIFKKRPAAGPSTTFLMDRGGTAHGG